MKRNSRFIMLWVGQFIDSEDSISPEKLEAMNKRINRHTNIMISFCNLLNEFKKRDKEGERKITQFISFHVLASCAKLV